MADIDFSKTFGAGSNDTKGGAAAQREQALVWLNIGYTVQITNAEGETENRFVSLPVGIPLDTMEHVPSNQNKADYAQFQAARNALLDKLVGMAKELNPGDAGIVPLEIQMRRVQDKRENATVTADSPFALPELKLAQ